MTRSECQHLIDAYLDWLKAGLSTARLGDACELTTPFLDRHNDHLQIYSHRSNGTIVLSDDGYILADLKASGLDLNTPKRKQVVETILRGFGVRIRNQELVLEASDRNLGQRVHSLVQAMLAVNDTFVLAQPRVEAFFWEDVKAFLDAKHVRYSPRVKLAGRTGYDHAIDFLIPRSAARPERLVQAINSPSKNTIASYLFALTDTRQAREEDAEAFAFLNDSVRPVGGDVSEALGAYSVQPIVWSQREQSAAALLD
jgi:hypothetical protein